MGTSREYFRTIVTRDYSLLRGESGPRKSVAGEVAVEFAKGL
jgi:hypothetical protein